MRQNLTPQNLTGQNLMAQNSTGQNLAEMALLTRQNLGAIRQ